MSGAPLILTYHAVGQGGPPLAVDPSLFEEHLDALEAIGARTLTISELALALQSGELPERAVALTFDDGFAELPEHAFPVLAERNMRATVFIVAGWLGQTSGWPSQAAGTPRRPLLSTEVLRSLDPEAIEIGAHGFDHAPLTRASEALAHRELVHARELLETELERPVSSVAYPYGAYPSASARALVETTYKVACTTRPGRVRPSCDRLALPRVDAHYLRDPKLLAAAAAGGLDGYLRVRRAAGRVRRIFVKDYSNAPVVAA